MCPTTQTEHAQPARVERLGDYMHAVIPVSIATCRTSGRSIQWGATWSLADELVYRQGLATKARKLANKGFDAARREALLAGADVNDETVAHFRNAEVDVIRLGW